MNRSSRSRPASGGATATPVLRARRLAVLGDLHLGRPGASLANRLAPGDLAAAAAELSRTHDQVVVNGDLFDLERGTLPFQGREYALLAPVHRAATAVLTGERFAWTRGNHDRVLERLGLASAALDVDMPCGRVRIEHGDRFNPPIKRWPPFTTFVTWVSGRVREVPALMPVYRGLRRAESVLSGHPNAKDEPIAAAAERWVAGTEHVGVVIGHTHAAVLRTAPTGFVFNPGDSIERVRALSIDGDGYTASLLAWSDGRFETVAERPFGGSTTG